MLIVKHNTATQFNCVFIQHTDKGKHWKGQLTSVTLY